jgi:hypothetical protein
MKVSVIMPNNSYEANIDITGTSIISVTPSTIYQDTLVEFELPPNNDQGLNLETEDGIDLIVTEDEVANVVTEYGPVGYVAEITYLFNDGSQEIDYIEFIQQA